MMKNQCYACHGQLEEGKAKCGICGMPVLKVVGDSEEAVEMVKQIAEEHRQKLLKGITISLIAYEHEEVNGKIKEKTTHTVKIANALDLVYGKTIWFDEKFARIDTTRTMDVKIVVVGDKKREINLEFKAPKMDDFWHVGVNLKEGFRAALQIGNEKIFVETDTFSLI